MAKTLVLLMAKTPEWGRVKTRLAEQIGTTNALWVYEQLLSKTVSVLGQAPHDVAVFYDPEVPKQTLAIPTALYHLPQQGKDLGCRMQLAFQWGFALGYEAICVLGTDLWELTPDLISLAFAALEKKEVVIGPSTDGGYYLLGLIQPKPELFENIPWSTDKVLKNTQALLEPKKVTLLPKKNDIDTLEDLQQNETLYQKYLTRLIHHP